MRILQVSKWDNILEGYMDIFNKTIEVERVTKHGRDKVLIRKVVLTS